MQLFRYPICGDCLVKRSEVALGLCRGTVAEGLRDPLPVDAVAHRQRLAVLGDGSHLVERGVGDSLVGEDIGHGVVGPQRRNGVRVGAAVGIAAHAVLAGDVALTVEHCIAVVVENHFLNTFVIFSQQQSK